MPYALLDITRIGYELEQVRPLASVWLSLYRGPDEAQQENTAPCLAGFKPGDAFSNWFNGAQMESVGIRLETDASPDELRNHLRRFLMVELEGDAETPARKVYFRYYDPDVLRVFLPTCDAAQLLVFFGPVRTFVVADKADEQLVLFTCQHGQLQMQSVPLQNGLTTPEDQQAES